VRTFYRISVCRRLGYIGAFSGRAVILCVHDFVFVVSSIIGSIVCTKCFVGFCAVLHRRPQFFSSSNYIVYRSIRCKRQIASQRADTVIIIRHTQASILFDRHKEQDNQSKKRHQKISFQEMYCIFLQGKDSLKISPIYWFFRSIVKKLLVGAT
jgi:hypothetical protein